MALPDLRDFVERSFAALEREAPVAYGRLCGALEGRRVRIGGDGGLFALDFHPRGVASGPADGREDIVIGIDRRTVLALVDGVLTLEEALRQDRFDVRASPADAASAFDALGIYVRGGIRCPSFPRLLSEFRDPRCLEETRR